MPHSNRGHTECNFGWAPVHPLKFTVAVSLWCPIIARSLSPEFALSIIAQQIILSKQTPPPAANQHITTSDAYAQCIVTVTVTMVQFLQTALKGNPLSSLGSSVLKCNHNQRKSFHHNHQKIWFPLHFFVHLQLWELIFHQWKHWQ